MSALLPDYGFDFSCEVGESWKQILANFGFWAATPAERRGLTSNEGT
ncbi:MAG: hypothetical protein HY901_03785 [Deltaproteobacteria bacterium]|nr:hypothetical protein [Deltaproteobacteria bacterium]